MTCFGRNNISSSGHHRSNDNADTSLVMDRTLAAVGAGWLTSLMTSAMDCHSPFFKCDLFVLLVTCDIESAGLSATQHLPENCFFVIQARNQGTVSILSLYDTNPLITSACNPRV